MPSSPPPDQSGLTNDTIDRGAQALWAAHGTKAADFDDELELEAAWANACADAEAVLRGALDEEHHGR